MAGIHLIGINRNDFEGPSILERKLNQIHPDIILVEGNAGLHRAEELYGQSLRYELISRNFKPGLVDAFFHNKPGTGHEDAAFYYAATNGIHFEYFNDVRYSPPDRRVSDEAKKEIEELNEQGFTSGGLYQYGASNKDKVLRAWSRIRDVMGLENLDQRIQEEHKISDELIPSLYQPDSLYILNMRIPLIHINIDVEKRADRMLRLLALRLSNGYKSIAAVTWAGFLFMDARDRTLYSKLYKRRTENFPDDQEISIQRTFLYH